MPISTRAKPFSLFFRTQSTVSADQQAFARYFWNRLAYTHDVYVFYKPYILRTKMYAICLRCFKLGPIENFFNIEKCTVLGFHRGIRANSYVYGKKLIRDYPQNFLEHEYQREMRQFHLQVAKWLVQTRTAFNLCANPKCRRDLHIGNILYTIFETREQLETFARLIEQELPVIFLCCDCMVQKAQITEFETL